MYKNYLKELLKEDVKMEKQNIADICENALKKLLELNPQIANDKLIWILNGSTLSNFLCNIDTIDGIKVPDEFKEKAFNFIRQPKGDIDILYTEGKKFNRGFEYPEIKDYQNISAEQSDYNFVDHNGLIEDCDINELCEYTTINVLKFIAKKPQYLFYYKYKELLAIHHKDILSNNLDSLKQGNILNDVISLYEIATLYCGEEEVQELMNNIYNNSKTLRDIYIENPEIYKQLLECSFNIIRTNNKIK